MLNFITTNAKKLFMAKKSKQYADNNSIIVKNILIKIHYFINMIKDYYKSLLHIYFIIITKILSI